MDPILANKLFEDGAIIFILDIPLGTELGIDLNTWKTGEKFKGIKMIPPGIHYIYYSSVSKEGSVAPRTGFFYNFKKKEVVVRRWNAQTEEIMDLVTEEEKECMKANIRSLDQNLGPYQFEEWKKWLSLSNKLTGDVVERVEPLEKNIASVAELIPSDAIVSKSPVEPKNCRRQKQECDLLPNMHTRPGTALNFTNIPINSFPEGSSPSDITKYSIDTSFILGQMLSSWERPNQLLAELQMAFLCFLIGQVYDAFEQWKNMIRILCFADEMIQKNPSLFIEFIGDLYFQLQEVPPDMFVDIVSSENFLIQTLRVLFENVLENDSINPQLQRRALQLKQYVTQRFQWDFDTEPNDEAPIVVETVGV